jgi:O-antigen/teichoic acid export membrane protein
MTEPLQHPTTAVDVTGADTYAPPDRLQPTVVIGVKWKFGSQVIRETTRLTVGIILARMLTPDEWGIAGMAFAVAGILYIVSDPVVGAALVQRRTITEQDRSTAFWMSAALGVSMCVLGLAFSGSLASFFGEPQVQGLFAALSVGFLISALGSVPDALLSRELAYRSLELRQIAGTLVGAAVAIPVALAGGGPWAIVANSLATIATSTVLLWVFCRWRPTLVVSLESVRAIGGFGLSVLGSHLLLYAQTSVDKILVGRYLGSRSLGTYAFAFNLMFTPIMNIAYPLNGVLFPALATIQSDEGRLVAAWLRAKRVAVAVMAPLFLTLFVVCPDLVPAVFGKKWDDAIPVLQLLCLAGVAQSLTAFNGIFLIVRGLARRLLLVMALVAGATTVSVVIGLPWGVLAVAAAYASAQWGLVVLDTWLTTRSSPAGFLQTLRAACTALPFVIGAAVAGVLVRAALVEADVPPFLRAVVIGGVVLGTYVVLVWAGSRSLRPELDAVVARIRQRRMTG